MIDAELPERATGPPGVRRQAGRLGRAAAVLLGALLLLGVVAIGLLQLPGVATWAGRKLVTLAPLNPGYRIGVDGVAGNWLTGIRLRGVRLLHGTDTLARADLLRLQYNPLDLLGDNPRIQTVLARDARIETRRTAAGWDLAGAFGGAQGDTGGTATALVIEELQLENVDGLARLSPDSALRITNLSGRAEDVVLGDPVQLRLENLGATLVPPGAGSFPIHIAARGSLTKDAVLLDTVRLRSARSSMAGRLTLPRSLTPSEQAQAKVSLRAQPLALADVAPFLPQVRSVGDLQLELHAETAGQRLSAGGSASLGQSELSFQGSTILGDSSRVMYRLRGEVQNFDPAALLRTGPEGSLTGALQFDLQGRRLGLIDGAASFHLSRSRLADTRIRTLRLTADFAAGQARLRGRGRVAGSGMAVSGWIRPFDSIPSYRLTGSATPVPIDAGWLRVIVPEQEKPKLNLSFKVSGRGITGQRRRLSGSLNFAAAGADGRNTQLGRVPIHLEGQRLRARPELRLAGGRVHAILLATLGDTIHYRVRNGTVDEVNLGALLGDTLAQRVSGHFMLLGRGTSPETAVAEGQIRLYQLRYGDRRLSDALARVRLRQGRVHFALNGRLAGGTVALHATARPFATPVSFSVDSARLSRVDLGTLLDASAWSGPVSLTATGGGRWGGPTTLLRGTLLLHPSRLGQLELDAGTIHAQLRGKQLSYDASVQSAAGALSLAGQARPFDSIPSLRIERGRLDTIDLAGILADSGLKTAINAGFSGSGRGRRLDGLTAELKLQLEGSRVNQARLGPGELNLSVQNGAVEGHTRLEGPDAHLAAELSGTLGGDSSVIHTSGTLRLEELARWTADSARNGRAEGSFDLRARLDSAGLAAVSGSITAFGGLGGVRVQTVQAVLAPSSGSIAFDTLMLRSNVAAVDGSGSLALRDDGRADTLRLKGRIGGVHALARLMGVDSLTLDSARFQLVVSGRPQARRISGTSSAYRLLYSHSLAEELRLDGFTTLDSAGLAGIAGRIRVRGLASGGVTVREASVAGRYDSLLSVEASAALSHGVRLALSLNGETQGDTTSLRLQRFQLEEGERTWRLAAPAELALGPHGFRLEDVRLQTSGRQIALGGRLSLEQASDFWLRADSVELGALERAGLSPVPGRLDGFLHLTGRPETPLLNGELTLTLHDGRKEDLGLIRSTLAWSHPGLRIRFTAEHQQGGYLTAQGTLPWGLTLAPEDSGKTLVVVREPGDSIDLSVQAERFEMALLRPLLPSQVVRELRGELVAQAHIVGTPEKPLAQGELRLTGLAFQAPALDVKYRQGRVAGRLSGDVVRIDTLLLRSGKDQELTAQGEVRLRPLTNPQFDLTARLREFTVSNSAQLQAQASGSVRLGGTLETPVLTGSLRLEQAEYFATGTAGLAVEDVELTPADRLELARHFGPEYLTPRGNQPGLLERFRLDLDLRMPQRVWFRRQEAPELAVEVSGRIRLRQEPGEDMRFFGTVEPIPGRSSLDVYGRTFQLTGGEIVLNGPIPETRIDVTSEYEVPTQSGPEDERVTINVQAKGRPDSLALAFSSDPEMPQDDILSYIVTGRPSSENPLIQSSGGGSGGTELVLGQLTEAISSAVGQELGFDVFQIRQDGTRGLTLSAGRYLTPQFYVSLQQPLELAGQDDMAPGANLGPGFELQYRVQPWLRVLLQGGSLPSGLRLRGRHAY